MRVIFLDFDGVLNSLESRIHKARCARQTGDRSSPVHNFEWLNEINLSNFIWMLSHLSGEIKIVLSTSWRLQLPFEEICAGLKAKGITNEVIGMTPNLSSKTRGEEILSWLKSWEENSSLMMPITDFIAIDDGNDLSELGDKFIQTSFLRGFTLEDGAKILNCWEDKEKDFLAEEEESFW